jgi:hypothetical protein
MGRRRRRRRCGWRGRRAALGGSSGGCGRKRLPERVCAPPPARSTPSLPQPPKPHLLPQPPRVDVLLQQRAGAVLGVADALVEDVHDGQAGVQAWGGGGGLGGGVKPLWRTFMIDRQVSRPGRGVAPQGLPGRDSPAAPPPPPAAAAAAAAASATEPAQPLAPAPGGQPPRGSRARPRPSILKLHQKRPRPFRPRTDEVRQPQRPHGLVGAQPHALVDVLRGADALGWGGGVGGGRRAGGWGGGPVAAVPPTPALKGARGQRRDPGARAGTLRGRAPWARSAPSRSASAPPLPCAPATLPPPTSMRQKKASLIIGMRTRLTRKPWGGRGGAGGWGGGAGPGGWGQGVWPGQGGRGRREGKARRRRL